MEKFITATGKTIDLAIAAALEQLGMDRDSVSVEVLDNPRSGFLGIGAQPARVKVTYEAPDEPPKPALSSASRSKPKKPVQEPASAPKVIAPAAPAAPAPAMAQPRPEPKPQQPKPAREPKPRPERKPQQPKAPKAPKAAAEQSAPAEPKVYAPAEPGSVEEQIEQFVKGLLEHMGSNAVPHAAKSADETYMVDLVGENLGILIGRRGETLDAIQHITSFVVNRGSADLLREYSGMNWVPFLLGLVLVGMEAGSIYAYRAGWSVSTLQVTSAAGIAALLVFVGYLAYHEAITPSKLIGLACCVVGLYFLNK